MLLTSVCMTFSTRKIASELSFHYHDIAVEVILDLSAAELLLERGLRGGVEHLLPDGGVVRGPAD